MTDRNQTENATGPDGGSAPEEVEVTIAFDHPRDLFGGVLKGVGDMIAASVARRGDRLAQTMLDDLNAELEAFEPYYRRQCACADDHNGEVPSNNWKINAYAAMIADMVVTGGAEDRPADPIQIAIRTHACVALLHSYVLKYQEEALERAEQERGETTEL